MPIIQKSKGLSLDRLLNDPMAMFGALGVLGAVVVTVWMVGGAPSQKEEDAGASFAAAPAGRAAAKAPVRSVGSSLGVAKLKGGSKAAAGSEGLKDAGGSASPEGDGFLRGTMAEIAASQKKADAKQAAAAAGRTPIPIEGTESGHVPGMAPDSTQWAAAGQAGFAPGPDRGNSSRSAASASAAPGGPMPPFGEAGAVALPSIAEGGALASASVGGPGRSSVVGGRPFLRGQTAGGAGPAAAGASQRRGAAGGLAGGNPGGGFAGGIGGGAGPGFSDTVSGGPGGSGPLAGAYGEASGHGASIGGGPRGGGSGSSSLGSGRGAQPASADGGTSGGSGPSEMVSSAPAAKKTELKDQAKKHLDEANTYRSSVVLPLAARQKSHSVKILGRLAQASAIINSLDAKLKTEQAHFAGVPDAKAALGRSRALIAVGPDSLKSRLASAQTDMQAGKLQVMAVPGSCGTSLANAVQGQDLMESSARRASNVRTQAGVGISMVDPEFESGVAALVGTPTEAARLSAAAARIKNDLGRVSQLLPDELVDNVGPPTVARGTLQQSIQDGYSRITQLGVTVSQRRLGYPETEARDTLDRNMADARRNAEDAVVAGNSLRGTSADTMMMLTSTSRSATFALADVCASYGRLRQLEGQAPK
ncbi:MAG: hypothetical protein HYZ75_02925 [Elusimicrobia bacterium]|nr:hypothetical protein [Elusimicrobiota bacterium]